MYTCFGKATVCSVHSIQLVVKAKSQHFDSTKLLIAIIASMSNVDGIIRDNSILFYPRLPKSCLYCLHLMAMMNIETLTKLFHATDAS